MRQKPPLTIQGESKNKLLYCIDISTARQLVLTLNIL